MRTLAVRRDFVAQHFLVGGDWGSENEWHSHHYRVEVRLEGDRLDRHGYLVDIVEIERELEATIARFRDRTLNELPELADRNPSLERFAELFCDELRRRLDVGGLAALTVILWESDTAWASYRHVYAANGQPVVGVSRGDG